MTHFKEKIKPNNTQLIKSSKNPQLQWTINQQPNLPHQRNQDGHAYALHLHTFKSCSLQATTK